MKYFIGHFPLSNDNEILHDYSLIDMNSSLFMSYPRTISFVKSKNYNDYMKHALNLMKSRHYTFDSTMYN